ncbi:MAG: flagellar motor switch protein FliN [Planctomycetaceae bacterium]|nr:flagellar motor switch protein FliN [Planctomycetaceae bacterium]
MAGPSDDLLNPAEIEALLNAAASSAPAPSRPAAPAPAPKPADSTLLDPSEIEALLAQHAAAPPAPASRPSPPPAPRPAPSAPPRPAAAKAPAAAPSRAATNGAEARPFQLQTFESRGGNSGADQLGLNALQDVELDLSIELGRAELLIEEVLQLREGSVVPLDKLAGDPVDILVNGRLIARGEVLVLNDNFCVRVAEILTPDF